MKTNDLVRHIKKDLGIGCIAKEYKSGFGVNFGLDLTAKYKEKDLVAIDTSACKTVTLREYNSRILSDRSTLNDVIVGNELRHYVGIGWTTTRVITEEDLKTYPRVIQN